jgi:hypothetical protein
MFARRLGSSILQNHIKSSQIYSRNVHAVPLAYNEFSKDSNQGENYKNNLIILHGLFGSKSNW